MFLRKGSLKTIWMTISSILHCDFIHDTFTYNIIKGILFDREHLLLLIAMLMFKQNVSYPLHMLAYREITVQGI